jgi:hypothetical protein
MRWRCDAATHPLACARLCGRRCGGAGRPGCGAMRCGSGRRASMRCGDAMRPGCGAATDATRMRFDPGAAAAVDGCGGGAAMRCDPMRPPYGPHVLRRPLSRSNGLRASLRYLHPSVRSEELTGAHGAAGARYAIGMAPCPAPLGPRPPLKNGRYRPIRSASWNEHMFGGSKTFQNRPPLLGSLARVLLGFFDLD